MTASFKEKLVAAQFVKNDGSSFARGGNTLTLSGHRITTRIAQASGLAMGTADVSVYGMRFAEMNELSTLGIHYKVYPTPVANSMVISAGDADGLTLVFAGDIQNAWFDGNNAPDTPFRVYAIAGAYDAVRPSSPKSFRGSVFVSDILQGLAGEMGLSYDDSSAIDATVANPYLWGSARDQVAQIAEAANIRWVVDGDTLVVWPVGGFRQTPTIPEVSVETGMIGYPSYTANGFLVNTIYNPDIRFGGQITMKSTLPRATGTFIIHSMDHFLDSKQPNGQWKTSLGCYSPDLPLNVRP